MGCVCLWASEWAFKSEIALVYWKLQAHFMDTLMWAAGIRSKPGPLFARILRQSSAINLPECHWVWRPLPFPITILNKRLTKCRPVVSFISLGQLTVTPLFSPMSVSARDASSSRAVFLLLFLFQDSHCFCYHSLGLDLTFGISTNSRVSVFIVETDIIVKSKGQQIKLYCGHENLNQ